MSACFACFKFNPAAINNAEGRINGFGVAVIICCEIGA